MSKATITLKEIIKSLRGNKCPPGMIFQSPECLVIAVCCDCWLAWADKHPEFDAAPNLLSALKELTQLINSDTSRLPFGGATAIAEAQAAIAKAERNKSHD